MDRGKIRGNAGSYGGLRRGGRRTRLWTPGFHAGLRDLSRLTSPAERVVMEGDGSPLDPHRTLVPHSHISIPITKCICSYRSPRDLRLSTTQIGGRGNERLLDEAEP